MNYEELAKHLASELSPAEREATAMQVLEMLFPSDDGFAACYVLMKEFCKDAEQIFADEGNHHLIIQ